jgi:hypothetical protein
MGRRVMAAGTLLLAGLGLGAAVLQSASGLLGHWELDAAAPGDDISTSNLDGTFTGAPPTVSDVPAPIAAYSTDSLDVGPALQYLEIPNSPPLAALQTGSYTVTAWFKAAAVSHAAPDDTFGIVMKAGYNEGLYWQNGVFAMEHWTTNTNTVAMADQVFPSTAGTWATTHNVGTWYHVAGVVDAALHTTTVYVHTPGVAAPVTATTPWNAYPLVGNSWTFHSGIPWRVGVANPATTVQWQADGLIDDVRLYSSALTQAQITAIATGADLGAATPTVVVPPPVVTPPPPAVPRTNDHDEGFIDDRCACGSTAGDPSGPRAAALAVLLAAFLACHARGRRA